MINKQRVILFGAGLVGRQSLPNYTERLEVIAFADNDPLKHGTNIMGIEVISAEQINERKYDLVVITSTSVGQIMNQLLKLGIQKQQIKIAGEADNVINRRFPWDAIIFLMVTFSGLFLLVAFCLRLMFQSG